MQGAITDSQLQNWFTHHPPAGNQAERYTAIRNAAIACGE